MFDGRNFLHLLVVAPGQTGAFCLRVKESKRKMNQSELHWFYTGKAWRQLRKNLIASRGCKCERCGKLVLNDRDLIGHHTIELTTDNVNNPRISLNPELIKLWCFECHEKDKREKGLTEFDQDGLPYPPL